MTPSVGVEQHPEKHLVEEENGVNFIGRECKVGGRICSPEGGG
jgi:hypothetical protein